MESTLTSKQESWVRVLTLSPTYCVTLGNLLTSLSCEYLSDKEVGPAHHQGSYSSDVL